jgi:uncharacterized protein
MAHVTEHAELDLESPMLVEGLPGVGLVGKIAADHLVKSLEMTHYASCYCEGLPRVAVYEEGESTVRQPVRIYADTDRDLLVLQSDVPVSPQAAPEFASCLTGWFVEHDVTPICLSGLAREKEDVPELYGVGTGEGEAALAEHDVAIPSESGMISGPTGALLAEAGEQGVDSVGLVVEANAQFPDPEAARILLVEGIEPLTGVEVGTDKLVEQAEEIAEAREKLAKRMQQAEDESTQAQPLGMYQ